MSGGAVVTIGAPEGPSAASDRRPAGGRTGGRIRLLIVTPRFLPETGGVETHVYETSRRLVALGVAVTVLCTDASGDLPPHDTIDDVTIRRVRAYPADRDLRLAPAIGRIVREGDWDLVHVQSYHTLVAPHAMLACVRSGTPFVLSFHAGGHSGRVRTLIRPAQQWALRPLLARAARLIALARFEVELYGRRLRLPPERFASVPNGSDLPSLPPGDAPRVDPDLIASVGRLERYKGHHRVIAALPFVLARRPRARLWIAGSGPYRSELERIALRLGVGERVEIRAIPPSERSTMAAELSRAAVVTLLSDFETHPIVVLEAAALGRPVLVADTSGQSELAQQGFARAIPLAQLAIAHRRRHHRGDEPFRGHSPADHPHVGRLRRAAPRRLPRRPRHRVMRILMVSPVLRARPRGRGADGRGPEQRAPSPRPRRGGRHDHAHRPVDGRWTAGPPRIQSRGPSRRPARGSDAPPLATLSRPGVRDQPATHPGGRAAGRGPRAQLARPLARAGPGPPPPAAGPLPARLRARMRHQAPDALRRAVSGPAPRPVRPVREQDTAGRRGR